MRCFSTTRRQYKYILLLHFFSSFRHGLSAFGKGCVDTNGRPADNIVVEREKYRNQSPRPTCVLRCQNEMKKCSSTLRILCATEDNKMKTKSFLKMKGSKENPHGENLFQTQWNEEIGNTTTTSIVGRPNKKTSSQKFNVSGSLDGETGDGTDTEEGLLFSLTQHIFCMSPLLIEPT